MENKYPRLEPWTSRPAFTEGWWTPDTYAHETETLTRALQISLSTDADYTDVLATIAAAGSTSRLVNRDPAASASASASDAETAPRGTRIPALSPPTGKVSKRKTRGSKRATTTFVVADPANFRQMVQQVTGNPFGRAHAEAEAVLRPEPRWAKRRVGMEGGCLPTLDTSAFLLEQAGGPAAGSSAAPSPGSQASFGSGPEAAGFDIDPSLLCLPTLESWGIL